MHIVTHLVWSIKVAQKCFNFAISIFSSGGGGFGGQFLMTERFGLTPLLISGLSRTLIDIFLIQIHILKLIFVIKIE